MSPRDDFDLDALLRAPTEQLRAPDGSWELISKRARRRKWVKASVAVSAGVVIAAGAVPAVIAVRHNTSNGEQTVGIAKSSTPPVTHKGGATPNPTPSISVSSPTPTTAATTLVDFRPDSLSFISQSVGYLWGSIGADHRGVVAETTTGGTSWVRRQAPPVEDSASGDGVVGDSQIRFVSKNVGFIFGAKTYITQNGGASWSAYSTPGRGYVDDIEAMNHRIWALIRPSQISDRVRLYTATAAQPSLQLVSAVKPMTALRGADAIAVNNGSVAVIAGSSDYWSSKNGVRWQQLQDPCQSTSSTGSVQNVALSTLDLGTVIAGCGFNVGGSSEDKTSFVSHNWGKAWTPTAAAPGARGSMQTLAAGTTKTIVVGTTRGAQFSSDAGRDWASLNANGVPLGFIGFINTTVLVAVSDRADTTEGAFATSPDSGADWTVYSFNQ